MTRMVKPFWNFSTAAQLNLELSVIDYVWTDTSYT